MSTVELRKLLIQRIRETEDIKLLEEAYRLLEMEADDFETYNLTDDQKNVVNESREELKRGEFLTDEQANKDIDKWLNK